MVKVNADLYILPNILFIDKQQTIVYFILHTPIKPSVEGKASIIATQTAR